MTLHSHERYCSEVLAQTGLLCTALEGADLKAPVPTCPEWTLADLLHHLGQAHRGVARIVEQRLTGFPGRPVGDATTGHPFDDAAGAARWLAEGAEALVAVLRASGPDATVWTFDGRNVSAFWARRMVHETVIHRADALLALGADFTIDPEIAADTLDEWLDIVGAPMVVEFRPELKKLCGPGRTLHLHATDTAPESGEWFIDATGELVTWRRSHEKAAVAVRGPMRDLLLLTYRRLPLDSAKVEVHGEREMLELWLENAKF